MTIDELINNKNILVFGFGLNGGGLGDALFLDEHGANVRVTDIRSEQDLATTASQLPASIGKAFGGHSKRDIEWADIILKNPAVSDDNEFIVHARELGKNINTSTSIYLSHSSLKIIGITGTRGKTTTVTLLGQILELAYPGEILVGGNLRGTSVLQLLDQEEGGEYCILELSSFQLAGLRNNKISPHISVVTNIYQDHLNRYKDMQEYIKDKLEIVKYQKPTDFTVLNTNDKHASIFKTKSKARIHWFDLWKGEIGVAGDHNRSNAAAADKVAEILSIDRALVSQAIKSFSGIPYRLERVGEHNGVIYINDTTSTTPIATVIALNSIKKPIVVIIGGASKNLSLDELSATLRDNSLIKAIILLGGEENAQLQEILKEEELSTLLIARTKSMQEAVSVALQSASSGDVVLLSPGFASFDLFDNEFDRGDQFNQAVRELGA